MSPDRTLVQIHVKLFGNGYSSCRLGPVGDLCPIVYSHPHGASMGAICFRIIAHLGFASSIFGGLFHAIVRIG